MNDHKNVLKETTIDKLLEQLCYADDEDIDDIYTILLKCRTLQFKIYDALKKNVHDGTFKNHSDTTLNYIAQNIDLLTACLDELKCCRKKMDQF